MPALSDANRDVRVSALRLSERWLRTPNHPIAGAVLKRLDDTDWAVRRQLAATLGELPAGSKEAALASILERRGDDPIAVDVALSGLRGIELAVLDRLLREREKRRSDRRPLRCSPRRSCAPAKTRRSRHCCSGWPKARARHGSDRRCCAGPRSRSSARRCPARRSRGAGDPNAPCEKCPGGRGGPGGARAFPGALEGADPPAPPARAGGPFVALSREPALTRVAAQPGELGDRAAKVMARFGWPGKAGVAPAAAPLNAEEQKRFAAGQEIYRNLCEGCHGADGREQPGRRRTSPARRA